MKDLQYNQGYEEKHNVSNNKRNPLWLVILSDHSAPVDPRYHSTLHREDDEVAVVFVDRRGSQEPFGVPVVVDVTSVDLIENAAEDEQQTQDHKNQAKHVVIVIEIKGPSDPVKDNNDASNSQHSAQGAKHIVDCVAVLPPVLGVAVRVELAQRDDTPAKPHKNAMERRRRVSRRNWLT